ncbi:reverse transcriptase domain, reverse transcriptase zinc-binding domain protein [Tanacetum coccineum]|uniref:Reverse transcriptase domain, reverse transcriptase zinc-binding domain protein n=1 Tax=Tanacetum coccineum TaxID=301880 RepID=A0ABQ5ESK8_9ASTR
MVWFPSCIPIHAINLWLIIRRKLKTHDLVPMWDVSDSLGMVCSVYESVPDSHDHLFFECPFAKGIWDRVKDCAGLAHYTPNVYDIIQSLMPIMKRRTTNSVVAKLVVAAATYYVWQERIGDYSKKKKKFVKRLVEKRVAKAIEEYEKSRTNLDSAESSEGNNGNDGGTVNVQGCSHKTFMNGKPHSFNGTEGVVGLRLWREKVEQVFEICKCAEEDKVMFAASTFEGRALTWWNGNVHTLGLVNANRIP